MKQYEFRYYTLPLFTDREDIFTRTFDDMMHELNRLGEEGWKESFKHGSYLVLRRVKPDGVLSDDPVEPVLPQIHQ